MRLTLREKEIVDILKKEPLISQEELAGRLNITRSSIAVHISNLMKKGVILGRAYIFNERVSGVVLGQSGLELMVQDLGGEGGWRPARVDTRLSGFAYQVSCCLARFGMDVKVLTVVGVDEEGDRVIHSLQEQHVDTANIYRSSQGRTSHMVRLSHQDETIEYCDVFGHEVFEQLLEVWEWLLFNCEWLVVEPSLQQMLVQKMADYDSDRLPALCSYRLLQSGDELPDYLAGFHLLALGVSREIQIETWLEKGLALLDSGLDNLVITDGFNRVVVCTRASTIDIILPPNQGFDIREGLEPFLAGLVYGLSQGYQFRQAVRIGSGIASTTGVSSA